MAIESCIAQTFFHLEKRICKVFVVFTQYCLRFSLESFLTVTGVHVEYTNAPRHQWDEVDQITTLFEESAWPVSIGSDEIRCEFQLIKSLYFRSSVMLDVYEQSGDPEDRNGGYVISVLQAL